MSNKKPVVVYGASGYTGRLICEHLRHYGIPFVAAGRNAEKIAEVMSAVPGIDTADYEVVGVDNDVDALTELFTGRKVVCNVVGPFERFGDPVVQAALNAGVHYIDTTGEPAFVKDIKTKYADQFRAKNLVMAPCTAYMYIPAEICARIAMEEEDIDSLEVVTCGNFVPTHASTQSIYSLFSHDAQYLKGNEMVSWPAGRGYEASVPGHAVTQIVHPWGGGSLPILFEDDPAIHTCRQFSGTADRETMEGVIALQQQFEAEVRSLPEDERIVAMQGLVDDVEPFLPPREISLIHRSCDFAVGTGSAGGRKVVIQSTRPYTQTGMIQAATAAKLCSVGTNKTGFASACEAVGHRYQLRQLKQFFPLKLTISDF